MTDDQKPAILIVDDNQAMLETLADILDECGYRCDTAASAEDATKLLNGRRYAAAIVDIVLPGMNGVEFCRKLKKDYPETKFVIITAYADSELAHEAEDDETLRVLYKPVDPMELIELAKEFTGSGS